MCTFLISNYKDNNEYLSLGGPTLSNKNAGLASQMKNRNMSLIDYEKEKI